MTIFEKQPDYPIFDCIWSLCIQALFAIALGCNVLPGGIYNFGAAKVFEEIKATINWKLDNNVVMEYVLYKLVEASKTSKPMAASLPTMGSVY